MNAITKLAAEHDLLSTNYDKLLAVLHQVQVGKIVPGQLAVDLQARTWEVREADQPGGRDEPAHRRAERRQAIRAAVDRAAGRVAEVDSNGESNGYHKPGLTMDDLRALAEDSKAGERDGEGV